MWKMIIYWCRIGNFCLLGDNLFSISWWVAQILWSIMWFYWLGFYWDFCRLITSWYHHNKGQNVLVYHHFVHCALTCSCPSLLASAVFNISSLGGICRSFISKKGLYQYLQRFSPHQCCHGYLEGFSVVMVKKENNNTRAAASGDQARRGNKGVKEGQKSSCWFSLKWSCP